MSQFRVMDHDGEALMAWLDDESTPESFIEKIDIIEMQVREDEIGKFLNNFNFLVKIERMERGRKTSQGGLF